MEYACNVGDLGVIPSLGRSPGGGHGSPLGYSCWRIRGTEDPGGQHTACGVAESGVAEQLNTHSDLRAFYIQNVHM